MLNFTFCRNICQLTRLRFIFLFVFYLITGTLTAQVSVNAKLDKDSILIGDHVNLILEVSNFKKSIINFPLIPDTLGKIEIINRGKFDTIRSDNNEIIRQNIIITCFDSGKFIVPPLTFSFFDNKDSVKIQSDSLYLSVKGIIVDTTKEIKDIKPPIEVPFSLKEFLKENIVYIASGIILFIAVIFLYKYLKNRKKPVNVPKPVPTRPAHIIAYEQLDILERQKLWQQGDFKRYHSDLSIILRTYIEHRYGINALELTSDEIINAINLQDATIKSTLLEILRLADLVKFAKHQPINIENELSLNKAKSFIDLTKKADAANIEGGNTK